MKCPVCTDRDLLMTERQGVEIDYCPQCRGVWLDRGELDKIIERSSSATAQPAGARPPEEVRYSPPPPRPEREHGGHGDHHGHDDRQYGHGQKHGKKSLFKELFDF
ncbi:MAG: hypothetical protein HGA96_10785 [Desulfobulbaceae bacterium]|nr:hypothetical protein [Desulfobulbaceae bacterium]